MRNAYDIYMVAITQIEKEAKVDIRVGTFNLNNLFSRFNLYTEADPQIRSTSEEATKENPREWLESAAATESADGEKLEIVGRGTIGPDGKLGGTAPSKAS